MWYDFCNYLTTSPNVQGQKLSPQCNHVWQWVDCEYSALRNRLVLLSQKEVCHGLSVRKASYMPSYLYTLLLFQLLPCSDSTEVLARY